MLDECYHISEEDFLAAIHTSISSIEKNSLSKRIYRCYYIKT